MYLLQLCKQLLWGSQCWSLWLAAVPLNTVRHWWHLLMYWVLSLVSHIAGGDWNFQDIFWSYLIPEALLKPRRPFRIYEVKAWTYTFFRLKCFHESFTYSCTRVISQLLWWMVSVEISSVVDCDLMHQPPDYFVFRSCAASVPQGFCFVVDHVSYVCYVSHVCHVRQFRSEVDAQSSKLMTFTVLPPWQSCSLRPGDFLDFVTYIFQILASTPHWPPLCLH